MNKNLLFLVLLLFAFKSWSQNNVGIGTLTPSADAVLDLVTTDKGFLAPRVTSAQRLAIPASSKGLLVFDSDLDLFFYWTGTAWQALEDNSTTNELITAATFNNSTKMLSVTEAGTTYNIDLNILNQDISFSNDTLYLSDGSQVYFGEYHKDSSSTNELIVTTNFNNVTKVISITDQGNTFTQDLSILNQRLSFSNDSLSISDGNSIYLGEYHKDSSSTNELITNTSFNTITKELRITDQGNMFTEDLSILNQQLNFGNDTLYLSDANQVYLGEYHKDSSETNELQMLSISNDTLFLERGGFVILDVRDKWNTDGNTGTDATSFLGTIDNQPLRIRTNNTEKVTVLQNGNVGIGATNPADRLVVNGGRMEITNVVDATGTTGSGSLEIGNSLRIDNNEMITDSNTTLFLNSDNNGDVQMDTEGLTFFLDADSNRLGVGTNAPDARLDVNGNIELSGGSREVRTQRMTANGKGFSLTLKASDNRNNGFNAQSGGDVIIQGGQGFNWSTTNGGGHIYLRSGANETSAGGAFRNGGYIIFQTGAANGTFVERARMIDNGNLGLGTTAPTSQLDLTGQIRIRGGAPAAGRVLTSDANGLATWQTPTGGGTGDITAVTAGAGLTGGGTTGAVTLNANANNGLTVNAGADRIQLGGQLVQNTVITQGNNGMVYNLNGFGDFIIQDNGINHFSVLDNGSTFFGGDVIWRDENTNGTSLASMEDDGNDGRFRIYENGATSVDLDANTAFIFNEQGLDRNFRVESDLHSTMLYVDGGTNRVGVGSGSPGFRFDILGQTAQDTFIYRGRNGAATGTRTQIGSIEYFKDQSSTIDFTGGSNFSINLNAAAAYNLQLATNSAAKPGSNTWTVASDARLKEDVNPYNDGLAELKQINPVYFKYNGKANIADKNYHVGVIAQELEKVAPYMVGSFESADGNLPFEEQEANTKTYKSVDNGAMTYMLINAVKELDAKIEAKNNAVQSDFGMIQMQGDTMFIPFSSEFKNKLAVMPIVTVTPIGTQQSLTIVSQSKDGFKVCIVNSELPSNCMFNWIAMAKNNLGQPANSINTETRQDLLNKVKAAKEVINYEAEKAEALKMQANK